MIRESEMPSEQLDMLEERKQEQGYELVIVKRE